MVLHRKVRNRSAGYNRVMIHEIIPVGMLQCNCSIFGDEQRAKPVVIDPGDKIDDILEILAGHALRVKAIVITHAHIDHIGGAAEIEGATGAPVYMNANDQELYDHLTCRRPGSAWRRRSAPTIDVDVREGDTLALGGTEFQLLHTPGHTQGSISVWIPAENKLVAGDTLFRDSIGRTDLPGGDYRQILRSIHTKLLTLPEEAIVIPGHGPNTTIGREKERNPFLQG